MKNKISSKAAALFFGVLVMVFLAVFYVSAVWQEPSGTPPAPNADAPINVGATGQTKLGDLTVNGILKTLQNMMVNTTTIMNNGDMSQYLNADKIDDYHAADLLAGGPGGCGDLPALVFTNVDFTKVNVAAANLRPKITVTQCNGNLSTCAHSGGLTGVAAGNAVCSYEFPGYHFCDYGAEGTRDIPMSGGHKAWYSNAADGTFSQDLNASGYKSVSPMFGSTFSNGLYVSASASTTQATSRLGAPWLGGGGVSATNCDDWTSGLGMPHCGMFSYSYPSGAASVIWYDKFGSNLFKAQNALVADSITVSCGSTASIYYCSNSRPLLCCPD